MWILRLLLLAVALTASASALGKLVRPDCSIVRTAPAGGQRFDSVAATLLAMASAHLAHSQRTDREYVGGVLHDGAGKFWATVGTGCPGQDTVTFAVRIPPGAHLAAFWHTHGAPGLFRDLFSPDDVALVRDTGTAFYLITASRELRVLRPDDLTAEAVSKHMRARSGVPRGASAGRLVMRVVEADEAIVNSWGIQASLRH